MKLKCSLSWRHLRGSNTPPSYLHILLERDTKQPETSSFTRSLCSREATFKTAISPRHFTHYLASYSRIPWHYGGKKKITGKLDDTN